MMNWEHLQPISCIPSSPRYPRSILWELQHPLCCKLRIEPYIRRSQRQRQGLWLTRTRKIRWEGELSMVKQRGPDSLRLLPQTETLELSVGQRSGGIA